MQRKIVKYSSAVLCVFISITLLFAPFNVNIIKGALIEKNEAHAVAPVFAGASAFLAEMATAAGFASAGDFVATIAGVTAVGTGMNIATGAGINYGNTAADNLEALIDAADYPAWDTLSSSEQTAWGSRENYDSSKFNSLMTAFGFGDAYGRYQNGWGQGGNGEFSFTGTEQTTLDKIKSIGDNWANGIGNTIDDIRSGNWISSNDVIGWYPATAGTYDGSSDSNWPSNWPNTVRFIESQTANYVDSQGRSKTYITNVPVRMLSTYNSSTGSYIGYLISNSTFTYKLSTSSSWQTPNYNSGNNYYIFNWTSSSNTNLPITTISSSSNGNYVLGKIANGTVDLEEPQEILDYPATDIENGDLNQTVIYFPASGIDSSTNWDDFLTYQEEITEDLSGIITLLRHIDSDLHKFNFYNDGLLKVHDEGVFDELSDIYLLLMEISSKIVSNDTASAPEIIGDFDFDDIADRVPNLLEVIENVAPFGAMLVLTELYTVLSIIDPIDDPEFVVPFQFGGLDDNLEVTIDLSWMDDIKPVINFFCILMLLLAMTRVTMRIVELEAAS